MSTRLQRNCKLLKVLSTAKPQMVKAVIGAADKDLITCLCECAHNVIKGNVPLSKAHLTRLQRHKKHIRELAKKRTTQQRKRKLLQTGGFLPALLAPLAASALLDLV